MKARRLEFGYLKSISSADEKTFPMIIRAVSMKELLIIFPNLIIGLVLFLKQEMIYAAIPLMIAIYVLFYNEKSIPFYYQFLAFIEDFLVTERKGKKPKETKPSKINRDLFSKHKKELELLKLSSAVLALSVMLYIIQLELYTEKINIGILVGLSVIAGLLITFVVTELIKLIGLVSKR
jgi:hypothetical protein